MFLRPTWVVPDILDMPLTELRAHGVQGFIFDLDNTVMAPHTGRLSDAMIAWLASLQADGWPYVIVSNNKQTDYLQRAEASLGVPVLGPAAKPSRRLIRQALSLMSLAAHQVAVVGDRPLTDIWAGQRTGCPTVLVDPLTKHTEHRFVQFLRRAERLTIQTPRP